MTKKHYFTLASIIFIILVGYAMRNSGQNNQATATTVASSPSAAPQHYSFESNTQAKHRDKTATAGTPQPTIPPVDYTPDPNVTPDRHDERVQYQQYWNNNVGDLAMAFVCITFAAKTVATGDSVGASQLLQKGKNFADRAKSNLAGDAPEKFNNDNISLQLFNAADKLSDAISKESDYLDSQKPSDGAAAIDEATEARDSVDSATEAAQSAYVDMGGKASDLETMQQKVKETVAAMDTLLNASNNNGDNQ